MKYWNINFYLCVIFDIPIFLYIYSADDYVEYG
jgi:hypothetical protein